MEAAKKANEIIYLDHAATTPVSPEVLEEMLYWLKEGYGNASSVYGLGLKSAGAIREARERAASLIHAEPGEIYFTSGGSEADNWALISTAEKYAPSGGHIITSAIEHHAILNTCKYLEKRGYTVTYLKPDGKGFISAEAVRAAVREDTFLISIMTANNEIGTIEPIREIGALSSELGIFFHTDAVQAFGHIPIDVREDSIDLLSASAHKLNGPKGVGLLYMRKGLKLKPLIHGGQQERGRRAGTENVAGIVAFGTACRIAEETMDARAVQTGAMRNLLYRLLKKQLPEIVLNGPDICCDADTFCPDGDEDPCPAGDRSCLNGESERRNRLPNNLNIRFPGVNGEQLLLKLSEQGICASAGSACQSGSVEPSHVLRSIGRTHIEALESLRFTLGHETTEREVRQAAETIAELARSSKRK